MNKTDFLLKILKVCIPSLKSKETLKKYYILMEEKLKSGEKKENEIFL